MRIGIVTNYTNTNYGSVLQSYALQKTLTEMGHESENIRFSYGRQAGDGNRALALARRQKSLLLDHLRGGRRRTFRLFRKRYIRESRREFSSIADLTDANRDYDAFICGSDQVWGPHQFNEWYYLSFAEDRKLKIAYAPSIGHSSIPGDLKSRMTALLSRFDAISIREKTGARLLRDLTSQDVPVVLDPTLLLSGSDWSALARSIPTARPYAMCYFLSPRREAIQAVTDYCDRAGLEMLAPVALAPDVPRHRAMARIGPREFIDLVSRASVVFTDSLHGTIFSIIFRKPFFSFMRFTHNDPMSSNSRVTDFLDLCGVENYQKEDCVDLAAAEPAFQPNYRDVEARLREKKAASIAFLSKALLLPESPCCT